MPELPEVEYAARLLRSCLDGQRLQQVQIAQSRVIRPARAPSLMRALEGQRVTAIERRGKWLRFDLSDHRALFSHLGMTGKWVARRTADPPEKHERARLDVRGRSVRYVDPRLFGRLLLRPSDDPPEAFRALGPDPLVDGIDPRVLGERLRRTRRSIKETLLDQSVVAGVGNIQAAESLWRAKLAPTLRADELAADPKALRALARAILASIEHTLAAEGDPTAGDEITYVEEAGGPNPFWVYGRAGEPCRRCRSKLARMVQAGRATFYCPRCQRR